MELIAHPLIERLGWTLLHSVWQGAAIALAYALATWWARGRGPELRYALSLAALALLALAPVATFLWIGEAPAGYAPAEFGASDAVSFTGATTAFVLAAATEVDLVSMLQPSLPWIVALWCTGVLVSALRVWDAWRHLVALRRSAVPLGGAELATLVARIAAELGLERTVRVARSTLVESPSVIGWFEPMILVPTAALAGLSPHQLAMILAHELAHIRRHDYLVNALQTVLETLLFFHPAVHWISARARQEREECCDAVAVRFGGDAIAYARALTELEELRGMRAALALGATGGVLLDRIERLLGQGPSRQRGTALASACALATLTALTATVSVPLLASDPLLEPVAAVELVAPSPTAGSDVVAATVDEASPTAAGSIAELRITTVATTPLAPAAALPTLPAPQEGPVEVATHAIDAEPVAGVLAELPGGYAPAIVATDLEPTAAPASGSGPMISGGQQLVGVAPAYPYGARSRGIGGTVTALLTVDASGRTQSVEIIAADPPAIFDRAVVRALSNWRYAPLLEDGVPLRREIIRQLEFVPESAQCVTVTGTRLCRKVGADGDRRNDGVTVIRLH